ncbi:chemoreceptor glutamine deamidase CheD [soil metagenome]
MPTDESVLLTLHPGDVGVATRGDRLETLLGSCVAIVLTDPRRTVGVMCHIVHSQGTSAATRQSTAHADVAFDSMVALLRERGIAAQLCNAYVYGGGNMFPHLVQRATIGDDNVARVLELLEQNDIPVLHADVGGSVYRQLRWTVGFDQPSVSAVAV